MEIAEQLYKDFTDEQKAKLHEIQEIELKILKEVDRICKKHGLHYSLSGGTLLGAIRHKDFIPWDDDIDLDLKRDDFNKLISILPDELGDEFEFINYNEYGEYHCDFIPRIFYKNSKAVNSFSTDGGKNNFANDERMNRIFIELYCLHDTDTKLVKSQIFKVKMIYGLAMGHRLIPTDSSNYSFLQKMQVKVLTTAGKLMPMAKIYKMYEDCVNSVKTGDGDLYFKPSVPLPVQHRNVFPKNFFASYTEVPIRNDMAMAPAEYIKVLEYLYTNWQDLPKEKDRHPGHFELLRTEIF
ncbi:MAG: LicD family protein [Clostridia bacterium]|nr:LicD family protein [Clostridia bacterium]